MRPATILRLHDVLKRTGLARSTLYLWMSLGRFPRQISLGGHSVGWLEADIDQWIADLVEKSRSAQAACISRTAAPAFNSSR